MLSGLDEQRIVRAIADAERGNRAEVRVHVEARCSGPVLERAARVYRALGLSRTQDDTAVLLYVAVKSRVAAVYSGKGVPDQREGFWQEIVDQVANGYREDHAADAIVAALARVGDMLRAVVGGADVHGNELSDAVTGEADVEQVYAGPPVDEASSPEFACIHCGAPLSFDPETDTDAACDYCGVVNPRAQALLRKRQAKQHKAERASADRRRRSALWLTGMGLAAVALVLVASLQKQSELKSFDADVARARAQVDNVQERQREVRKRYAARDASASKDAELDGAENRVRIERARYDQAAQRYNSAAGTAWGGFSAKLWGLPKSKPLSNEAEW